MKLEGCVVRVESEDGSVIGGTGFVVGPALVVTCAHVVQTCRAGSGDQVRLAFHSGGTDMEAEVLPDGWHPDADVAFLRLTDPLPEGATPAILGPSSGQQGKPVRVFGFPNLGDIEGLWGDGRLVGPVTTEAGQPLLQLGSTQITAGFSGGPVWDVGMGRVIGMVTEVAVPDELGRLEDVAFAVPAEVLGELRAGEIELQESRAPSDAWVDGRVAGLTATVHELPFGNLSPRDFERLCLALLPREGLESPEHFGAAGSEQGRDIVARRDGELWYVQCKRVKRCGAQVLLDEIAKIQVLMESVPDLRPAGILFMVSCDVSAVARDRAGGRCSELGLACEVWAGTDLDACVQRQPDIVDRFFAGGRFGRGRGMTIVAERVYIGLEHALSLPNPERVLAHRTALAEKAEYRRWADEFYIPEEGKVLPLLASPYGDDLGQQREDLLRTIRVHQRLLVLGEPGMGKTVAMQRMVWEMAQADDPVVPVFVPLLFFQGNLLENVRVALNETGELYLEDAQVPAFFRKASCLVMFDGLNEVPGEQRIEAVTAVTNFVRTFPRHRYVVTSRSQDKLWGRLRAGGIIEDAVVIQRITDEQARQYLIAHLAHQGDQRGKEVHDRLNECLRGLSHTPLLLWLIKEAALAGEELPGNRGELFDRFVDRMLRRDEGKLEVGVSRSVKKRALAHMAFVLQKNHQLVCKRERAMEIIAQVEGEYDGDTILRETLIHGLLEGEQRVRFLHQSVQEYFVALALRKVARAEWQAPKWLRVIRRLLRRNLATLAQDDWWDESFVQMAGLVDNPSWLVRDLTVVKPWLAFWCSIEGKPVDEKIRDAVESKTVILLHSKDVRQRLGAVRELSHLENPRTIEYLIQALDDNNDKVVNAVTQALTGLGEPAVELLLTALHGTDRIRRAAIRALGQIWQMENLVKLGGGTRDVRQEAVRALGQIGDARAVEPLIAALRDGDIPVRQEAVRALRQIGKPAVESLIVALREWERDVCYKAARALGQIGDARAVEPLIAALRDGDIHVRREAAGALGQISDPRSVEPLIAALRDTNIELRLKAVRALGQIWQMENLVKLGGGTRDCQEAARALGQIGDARAVEPLIAALGYVDKDVRQEVVRALGQIGEPAVEPLIVALRDEDRQVLQWVAEALGQISDPRAVEPLIAALRDGDIHVRREAVWALGQISDPRAVEPLIFALKDQGKDWKGKYPVQDAAAEVLKKIGTPEALAALEQWR